MTGLETLNRRLTDTWITKQIGPCLVASPPPHGLGPTEQQHAKVVRGDAPGQRKKDPRSGHTKGFRGNHQRMKSIRRENKDKRKLPGNGGGGHPDKEGVADIT